MLEHALRLLALGYSVFPVGKNKRPLVKWEQFQHRKPTPEEVDAWWTEWPEAGIGIVCGKVSGNLLVVDVDGPTNTWPTDPEKQLQLAAGASSRTGGGGRQFFMRLDDAEQYGNTAGAIAHKVDTRCEGGYVVAPPSMHPSGNRYEWLVPLDMPPDHLPAAPAWVVDALKKCKETKKKARDEWDVFLANGIQDGQRNEKLTQYVGRLFARGLTRGEVESIVHGINRSSVHPSLPDKEVDGIIQSIAERELLKAGGVAPAEPGLPCTPEQSAKRLEAVNDAFGLSITSTCLIQGQEPKLQLFMSGRSVMVPVENLIQEIGWARAIIQLAYRVPNEAPKKPGWRYYLNLILEAAERKDPGAEATDEGLVAGWISSLLSRQTPVARELMTSERDPIIDPDGFILINPKTLVRQASREGGTSWNTKKITQVLTSCGCKASKVRIEIQKKKKRIWMFNVTGLIDRDAAATQVPDDKPLVDKGLHENAPGLSR